MSAETAGAIIADDVRDAAQALLEKLRSDEHAEWRPRQLMEAARDARRSTVMSIAFWDLVNQGQITLREDMTVGVGVSAEAVPA